MNTQSTFLSIKSLCRLYIPLGHSLVFGPFSMPVANIIYSPLGHSSVLLKLTSSRQKSSRGSQDFLSLVQKFNWKKCFPYGPSKSKSRSRHLNNLFLLFLPNKSCENEDDTVILK